MTNKRVVWVLLLGVVGLSGLTRESWGLGEIGGVEGGVYHSAILTTESLQFGDIKTTIQRNSIGIPDDYGKLLSITQANGMAVLWFSNEQGVIRNVLVSGEQLWLIQRSGRVLPEK